MTHPITHFTGFPQVRMRRLREHIALRTLVRETKLSVEDMVFPLFIKSGQKLKIPIPSMPGQFQWSMDQLKPEIQEITRLGIPAVILFGIPKQKNARGSEALKAQGLIPQAIQTIKEIAPDLLVITDLCCCEYMSHGHCGVIQKTSQGHSSVDNDHTLEFLAQQAMVHAKAGADVIAPSGMMDGTIQALRCALDSQGFSNIPILSYSAKYASAFYSPFREAAQNAAQFGDRASYQMDVANSSQSLREVSLDIQEGADMIMVKPALAYLDIIYRIKQQHPDIPLAAFCVSGEYAMIKAAAKQGWLDERKIIYEMLVAIKRAGADFIIHYFAKEFAYAKE